MADVARDSTLVINFGSSGCDDTYPETEVIENHAMSPFSQALVTWFMVIDFTSDEMITR